MKSNIVWGLKQMTKGSMELKINVLVYRLYGLTEDEIKIIEGGK